ncbi:MAG TPA: hypothetical protein PK950_02625 [Candidatus Paceibacterota bacterium]|nr:hypothetical protein [Candidatus Paceibacterota bacterium]
MAMEHLKDEHEMLAEKWAQEAVDKHVSKHEEAEEPETEDRKVEPIASPETVASKNQKAESLKAEIGQSIDSQAESKSSPIVATMVIGKEKQFSAPKLEGETLTIDDQTFTVIGKAGGVQSNIYTVEDLTTGIRRDVDIALLENKARSRQENLHDIYKTRFDFTPEDIGKLENDPEYSKLSIGQKHFILQSLTGTTLEKVDELAEGVFQEEQAKRGRVGRFGANIFKNTKMADVKSRTFEKLRAGGYAEHKSAIDAIITRVKIMETPIIENEKGEVEVQYASGLASLLGEGTNAFRAQRALNQAATDFHNIPPEWESNNASYFKQKQKAREARSRYEAEKNKCIELYKRNHGINADAKVLELEFSKIDNNIELNRLMNAHPENERVLNDFTRDSRGKLTDRVTNAGSEVRNVGEDLLTRDNKGYYAAAGFAARTYGKYTETLDYLMSGVIGGAVGAARGWFTAKKNLRENEAQMRRGGSSKLGKDVKKGMFDISTDVPEMIKISAEDSAGGASSFMEKITMLTDQLKNETNPEKASIYRARLDNRVKHAIARARAGKITFGNKDERLNNQIAFMEAIKNAGVVSIATDPKTVEAYVERASRSMATIYGRADSKENAARRGYMAKFAMKNALIGTAFGAAGFLIREAYEATSYASTAADTHDALNTSGNIAARENTIVEANQPRMGKITATGDIKGFFNKPTSMNPLSPLDRNVPGSATDYISEREGANTKPPFAEGYEGDYAKSEMPADYIKNPGFEGIDSADAYNTDVAMDQPRVGKLSDIPADKIESAANETDASGMPIIARPDFEEDASRAYVRKSTFVKTDTPRIGALKAVEAEEMPFTPDPNPDPEVETEIEDGEVSDTETDETNKDHGYADGETSEEETTEDDVASTEYTVKPQTVSFSPKGSIETIRQLKETLAADYAGVDPSDMPASVRGILETDPTKLAIKYGFYKPGEIEESAMIMKGSTLEIDKEGNLTYKGVGDESARILESKDGTTIYKYDEKMFDYNGKTVKVAGASEANQINYPNLKKPDESIFADKGAQYEAAMAAKDAAAAKERILPQYGKSLVNGQTYQSTSTGGYYPTSNPNYMYDTTGRSGGMSGSLPESPQDFAARTAAERAAQQEFYDAAQQASEELRQQQQAYGSQAANEQMFQVDRNARYDLPKSPNGTYYKEVKINGQFVQLDTHSYNQNNAFDGVVNRRSEKLFDDTFGDDNKQIEILLKSRAVDDLNAKPTNPNDQITAHYLNIVKKIRADSGLVPKPNEPTEMYIKNALQRMKNNGVNIREYTSDLSAAHMQNGGIVVNSGNVADNSSVVSNGNLNKVKIISNKPKNIVTDDVYE